MRTAEQPDEQWFETTYHCHEHAVRSYAYRRVHPDQVDDIVAEVFTTLWRRRADAPEQLLPWLYRVASNHIAHLARSRTRGARLTEKLARQDELVGQGSGVHTGLEELFSELPPADAELLRLAYWEQLEPQEIAVVLQIRPGTARTRLHRARQRAARLLDSQISPRTQLIDPDASAKEVLT